MNEQKFPYVPPQMKTLEIGVRSIICNSTEQYTPGEGPSTT